MKRLSKTVLVLAMSGAAIFAAVSCATTEKAPSTAETGVTAETSETSVTEAVVEEQVKVEETTGKNDKKNDSKKTEDKKKKEPEKFTTYAFANKLEAELGKGNFEGAIALYDQVPEEYKEDYDLLFLKAAIYVSAGQLENAKTLCASLAERNPSDIEVLELSATIARAEGNTAQRNAILKEILAKDPVNATANIELAQDAFSKHNYKNARVLYKKALIRDKTNEDALFGAGQTSYFLEEDDTAKEYFNKLIEVNPDNPWSYHYLGKIAFANNEYQVAANNAKIALSKDPNNYDIWMDWGTYERYLGHFDNAEKAWTKAIEINPDYFLAYANRGGLYDETNRFAEALHDYKEIIRCNPEYYYAYESIGILALHEKNYTQARKAFMKCREYNENNISYPLMITYCYYMEGNKVEAKNYSDKLLRKMDRASIEYAMLRAYHDQNGYMSIPQRISTLTSTTMRGKLYYYMGLLYDMAGSPEGAAEYYQKVVNMNSPMFFEFRLAEWGLGIENGLY